MNQTSFLRLGSIRDVKTLRDHLRELKISIPCDLSLLAGVASPLAQPLSVEGIQIGNRFAVQPMEGWDGTSEGRPSDLTFRRWRHFGASGAKLIWGGEAVAVSHDGRANPNQLVINQHSEADLSRLREALVEEHRRAMGSDRG